MKHAAIAKKVVAEERERFETALRRAHGDEGYDRIWKRSVDDMFRSQPRATTKGRVATSAAPAKPTHEAAAPARSDESRSRVAEIVGPAGAMIVPMLPSAIVDSAEGLLALREGNFRAALSSALNLAPFGGVVKEGLQYASVLFGKKLL